MKTLITTWLCAAVVLTGCGGGDSPNVDEGQAFGPAVPRIDIIPQQTTLPANTNQFPPETLSPYLTPVNVRVLRADGSPIPDGVIVFLRSQDPRTVSLAPQVGNNFFALADVACTQTFGSIASFVLNSGPQPGTVQLTASVSFPPIPGTVSDNDGVRTCTIPLTEGSTSYFQNLNYVVQPGPAPFERLSVSPSRTNIAVNTGGTPVTPSSPFVSAVELTFRTLRGELVQSGTVSLSISPPIARFSLPDDPSTAGVNEFNTLLLSGLVPIVNGRATVYVHSTDQPGAFTLTAIASDPQSGSQITRQIQFNATGSPTGAPSNVRITSDSAPIYTRGTNGRNDMPLQVIVLDASNQPIPDSTSANVLLEILPVANGSGEVLAAQNVPDGATVRLRTIGGAALATFRSGNRQGVVTVRVTADRADNNVDNGIQNAVISQTSFVVSDGKLFDIELTSPSVRAILINGVDPSAEAEEVDINGTTVVLPPDPDGSYALTVSVVATDRQGQPVLPNTPIEFGLIDSPLVGGTGADSRNFALVGTDGDPEEAGSTFTATTGRFTTAGGGAGPGDTLIVFAEDSVGNRDLESARTVARVNSSNNLTIQNRFNRNDDTGNIVNNGPVLDYVIGRATTGNIGPTALTRANGVASVRMTYPVSQLGRRVVVWARGSGDVVNNSAEIVSEAELFRYPGVAPALLTASPGAIPANRTSAVQVCLTDVLGSGIQGISIGFSVQGSASTTVDGTPGSGVVTFPTGQNGCTTASVNAAGVVGPGTTITFSVGGATAVVTVTPPNSAVLQAIPAALGGQGGTVLLRLLDGNGNPISGILITGVCMGDGPTPVTLFQVPGVTNAQGETSAGVSAQLDGAGESFTGSCTFTAANGPSVVVPLQGIDLCNFQVSPLCPNQQQPQGSLVVQVEGAGVVTGNAGGLNVAAGETQTVQVNVGTVVQLTAAPVGMGTFLGWTGSEECAPGATNTVQVAINQVGVKTCIARFNP